MGWELKQRRKCDGVCCKESPREPINCKTTCLYLNLNNCCMLMTGEASMPDRLSKIFIKRSFAFVFLTTCVEWPHNTEPGKNLGSCCWEWVHGA